MYLRNKIFICQTAISVLFSYFMKHENISFYDGHDYCSTLPTGDRAGTALSDLSANLQKLVTKSTTAGSIAESLDLAPSQRAFI